MSPKKLLFVIVFVFCAFQANAKICQDVDVRNTVRDFETKLRGCTVVVGNLKIVLIHDKWNNEHLMPNISFPELTEITGFFLLFMVESLTSIGKLFPNLTVIRGDTLLTDYALIIHNLKDLQEIGLHNLRSIGRGSVRIEKCPQLCFVDTVHWSYILAPFYTTEYHDATLGDCESCPKHCNGTCWDTEHCQIQDVKECTAECLGCTQSNPQHCEACRTLFFHEGKCVSRCPDTKLDNPETRTCVTQQECADLPGKWWNFKGKCMRKCPDDYLKVSEEEGWCKYCGEDCYEKRCPGGRIWNTASAELFRGCTHINGSLEITVNTVTLENELEEALGKVKEIDGLLKIYRSYSISSLYFLQKLQIIRGWHLSMGRFSLLVYENQNLRELWNWKNFTLKIEEGSLFFHYNPLLCLSEVDKLVDVAAIPRHYSVNSISSYSNGDRTVCRSIDLKIDVSSLNSEVCMLQWKQPVVEIGDVVVGYSVHYIEDPYGNITLAYGRDVCFDDQWLTTFVTGTTCYLNNLYPFTQYAFYIKVRTLSQSSGGLTKIQRFTTLPGEPSPPTNIRVILSTSDSIVLTWDPPTHPGGIISHYKISSYLQEDDIQALTRDNYCFQPYRYIQENSEVDDPLEVWTNSTSCCKKQNWQEWRRVKRSSSHHVTWHTINVNSTKYELKNLKNFKIYILMISACNHGSKCSSVTNIYQRTQPKVDADDIPPGISVVTNDNGVFVKWLEPSVPNTEILSYLVEYRRVDLQHLTNSVQCLTPQDYKKNDYGYTITNFPPGLYSLTVKAVSLAGPGRPSDSIEFEIPTVAPRSSLVAYLITVIILVAVLLASGLLYYYRSKKVNWLPVINSRSAEFLYVESPYEMLREDIEVDAPRGSFGIICNAFIKSQNRPCTVKFAEKYNGKREFNKLLRDVTTMTTFKSYHVVHLLGIVFKEQPALIVTELMAWGDLKSFLQQSKDSETKLTNLEMYRMAAEIADGMTYLSSKKFVHLDLAARNCMVSAGHTVKIINFGINKDLYKTDYYKRKSGEFLPVRWMAPESLADGVFTGDSNVWSYGVVLWEIATFGEQPYGRLLDEEVIRHVIGQKVLEPPPNCPELLYEMMVACWRWRSKHRPIFVNLLKQLQSHVRRDFRLVSFYHSREASEYKLSAKNREYNLPARRIPLLDERPTARWNKQDDDIQLRPADDVTPYQSDNVPSTSSHI